MTPIVQCCPFKPRSISVKAAPHPSNKIPTPAVPQQSTRSVFDKSHGYTIPGSVGIVEYGHRPFPPSKQSSTPLSELSRKDASAVSPDARQNTSPMRSNVRRYQRSPSPFEGTVLVASTPSASGGSQSQQSQPFQEAQVPESLPDFPTHTSLETPMDDRDDVSVHPIEDCLSDAPSNFYAENNEDSLPSTGLEATQPCTQVDDAMDVEPTSVVDSPLSNIFNQTPVSTASNTTTTNPRSLLSMVSKYNRQRYLNSARKKTTPERMNSGIDQSPARQEGPIPSLPISQRFASPALAPSPPPQDGFQVETQPTHDEENFKPTQRRIPAPSKSHETPSINRHTDGPLHHTELGGYRTGVVPDIEPLRDTVPESEVSQKTALDLASVASKESSSDEEDIPLAAQVHPSGKSRKPTVMDSKGKGKLLNGRRPGPHGFDQEEKPSDQDKAGASSAPLPRIPTRAGLRTRNTPGAVQVNNRAVGAGRSSSSGIVPSSVPDEDTARKSVQPRISKVDSKDRTGVLPQPCPKPKRAAAIPPKRTRRYAESSSSESHLSASEDELLIKADQDEESGTEPADDLDMDPDFGGSKKRKRGAASVHTSKATVKPSKKARKAAPATPGPRQAKRLRSATSTSLSRAGNTGTRVFALWRSTSCYYSGTVYSDVGGGHYEISFDDNTSCSVSIDQMRRLDIRVNDDVMIPNIMRGFKVAAIDNLESSGVVSVRTDTGIKEYALMDLRLAMKTVSATWQDRILTRQMINPTIKAEPSKASPAPSSFITTARRPGRSHVFEKTAFVVSVSSNESDWEREKDNLMSKIKNSGGIVVNDWTDVVDMTGKFSENNNRWVIEKHEATWTGSESIERTFLLADQPSHKPKFLIALALGIPCLRVQWLYDSVTAGEEKDWLAYTLGQGLSVSLDTQVSQQLDMNWGQSIHHLTDIMGNKAPCKLLKGKSVLCVGDMVPKMKIKKLTVVEEKSHEAHNAATRIILAMGADRVEAVNDIAYASTPLEDFDLVIVKQDKDYDPELMLAEKTVHWNWVKECLVASRLLPQPQWACESQEA
ncbi:hypothetical protein H0H92_000005 [Tricholoma furcatifolium]|nr:hypothetical protein H0H92_000005 [Tricholoma furcatifolium]